MKRDVGRSVTEKEIDAAIRIAIEMYLFVTATNITELEMAGHYPNVDNIVKVIPFKPQGYENVRAYGMVAESFVDDHELTEAQRIDVLRQSLIQMFNHGGYRTSDKTFCKQRHWLSVYRVAADEGFIIEGDFSYFQYIINGMNLTNCKVVLNIEILERSVKGVYATSFDDWSDVGLIGRSLAEYNDIRKCASVFLQILSKNRPRRMVN